MELIAEFFSVVGALLLSVACGVLLEELMLGGLVRLILARQPEAKGRMERHSESKKHGAEHGSGYTAEAGEPCRVAGRRAAAGNLLSR